MFPGPVFEFESRTTARRWHFFAARAGVALLLLLLIYENLLFWDGASVDGALTIDQIAWCARTTFLSIAIAEVAVILALTPALVSGVIAADKQRKTLHYLMASRLTSLEIVAGKLLARLAHMAVFVAIGFPILTVLVSFGGIDPRWAMLSTLVAAGSALFLAGLSILVSTTTRRVRDSLFATYALEGVWLAIPLMIRRVPVGAISSTYAWLESALAAIESTSPTPMVMDFIGIMFGGPGPAVNQMIWTAGVQAGLGLLFAALAAWRLRPQFRAEESGSRRVTKVRVTKNRRGRLAIACQHPMLWKERFGGKPGWFARGAGWLLFLGVGVPLLVNAASIWLDALHEAIEYGVFLPDDRTNFNYSTFDARFRYLIFIESVSPLVYLVWVFGVAAAAASSVSSEHESDTWTGLVATDLTGKEIVFAKIIGALRRPSAALGMILFLAGMGFAVGALNVAGFAVSLAQLVVFGWFAAALGVAISLHFKSTWRGLCPKTGTCPKSPRFAQKLNAYNIRQFLSNSIPADENDVAAAT